MDTALFRNRACVKDIPMGINAAAISTLSGIMTQSQDNDQSPNIYTLNRTTTRSAQDRRTGLCFAVTLALWYIRKPLLVAPSPC